MGRTGTLRVGAARGIQVAAVGQCPAVDATELLSEEGADDRTNQTESRAYPKLDADQASWYSEFIFETASQACRDPQKRGPNRIPRDVLTPDSRID